MWAFCKKQSAATERWCECRFGGSIIHVTVPHGSGAIARDDRIFSTTKFVLASVVFGALAVFVDPSWAIDAWAWKLTPLTARVLAGWFALMGVGSLVLARERRWSACRVALQSFMLWHGLVLVGALWHREDFGARGLGNAYVVTTVVGLLGMGTLYLIMEGRRRRMLHVS